MPKKVVAAVIGLVICLPGAWLWFSGARNTEPAGSGTAPRAEATIRIAACPTCFDAVRDKLAGDEGYELLPTGSTAESLRLLSAGEADVILAGRKLKPGEPELDGLALGEGYSFLSSSGRLIYKEDLPNYKIFTDLDSAEFKNAFPGIDAVEVADVYKYLDQGIIITAWENTDYTRAEIVHIYEKDGRRAGSSRRPTLYCPGSCRQGQTERLVSLLQDN